MGLDDILKNSSRGAAPVPQQEEDPNFFMDVIASPFRGIEGALQGIYDLADYATGDDLLPDYNKRFLGRSQTFVGSLGEGVTQFLTGFVPVAGQLSKVGKLSKVTKAGTRALNLKGYAAAGAVADFTVFQAQEERLSNLIEAFPALENPVTEFLAADEDDGEIEGRLKNTLEGLAIGGATDALVGGLKALKRGRKGDDTTEILTELEESLFNSQRDREFLNSELNEESSRFYADMDQKVGGNEPPTNAYDMLRLMADGYDGEMRPVFDALLANAETTLRDAEFEFPMVASRDGNAATYNPTTHKISFKKGGYRTFAHELLHATTSREIYLHTARKLGDAGQAVTRETIATLTDAADDSAIASLYRTYDAVIKKLGKEADVYDGKGTDIYGLTNIHEFVTEGFTNPEFRKVLSSLASDSDPSKTMFDTFMDVVRNMLGLSKEQGTLLDDLMRDSDNIIRQQETQFNAKFDYLKEIDSVRGLDQRRTLDDRGEDFQVKEGEKSPVIEMQEDRLTQLRGKTLGQFKFQVKGAYQGQPIENVPDGYLRKAMSWNSVPDGVKARIESELNARQAGYASRPTDPFDKYDKVKVSPVTVKKNEALVERYKEALKDDTLTPAKRKETQAKLKQAEENLSLNRVELASDEMEARVGSKGKQAPEAAGRVVNEGMSPYRDADDYLNTVSTGGAVTPKEAYARYLKNRAGAGGLAENNSMRLAQYVESQKLRGEGPTNIKNPRIQGKSQRSSDFERAKRLRQRGELGVPSIDELRNNVEASKRWAFTMRVQQNGFGMEPEDIYPIESSLRFIAGEATDADLEVLTQMADSVAKNTKEAEKDAIDIIKKTYGPNAKEIIDETARNGFDGNKKLTPILEKADTETLSTSFTKRIFDEIKSLDKVTREKIADNLEKTNKKVEASDGDTVGTTAASAFGGADNDSYEDLIYLLRGGVEEEEAFDDQLRQMGNNDEVLGQRDIDEVIEDSIDKLANDLEAGGDQAIRSAGKNIRTTTQALAVVQAIAKNLEKAPKAEKLTAEELTAETEEVVDLLGGNKGEYAANIRRMQTQGLGLEQFRNTQTAIKKLIDVMSADAVDVAKQVVDSRVNPNLNKEALEVELLSTLDQLHEVQRLWSLMGREAGLTLVQRRFLTDPQGKYRVKENIGFNPKTATPDDYAKYRNQNQTGTMNVEKAADLLAGAKDAKDVDARIKQATGLAKEINGSKMMDVIMEYWMNSLLSGPTTQIVNLLGNSLTFTMRTLEQTTGALLTGDTQLAKATLRYAFSMETIADSYKIAKKTLKTTESSLTQGSRVFDDKLEQSKAIAMDGSDALSKSVNMLGSVIRVPSRALLAGDEFFKQMNYRTYVKTNLAYEAMKKGAKSGPEVAEYVQKNLDNFLTKGARAYNEQNIYLDAVAAAKAKGLTYGVEQQAFISQYLKDNKFDETRGGLADAALGFAEENTFTNDLANEGFISTLSNTLNTLKHKGGMWSTLNFVVPFLRTPTNIIKFSLDRTPFGVMPNLVIKSKREELLKQLTSDDPVIKAQATGKMAMASSVFAAGLYYVSANKEFITGGGPPNKDELENLRQSGWRPYSIKIGDTYYSYQRLDPLATIIGLFADIVEGHHYHELEGLPMQDMAAITIMSLTNNVTNKSYVKGLDTLFDLIRDPVGNFGPFAGNIAGGFAPTFLSQVQNMADERELKETRAIFDYFLKKLPNNGLPTRRNFMGEAMLNQNSPYMTGIINPIYFNKESKDIVDKELSALQYGFSRPTAKLFGALDMRDAYNGEGRQAYDRMLELSGTTKINGVNMRDAMRKLMKDPRYQALPQESDKEIGEISPRVKAVQRLVRAYRRKAKVEMLDEFPELQQSITQLQQDRQQYRSVQ